MNPKPVSVLLFGIARDLVGQSQTSCLLPPEARISDLLAQLHAQHPALSGIKSLLVACNGEYADNDAPINQTDEIAIIPPVSGG
jgi:molybdopterin converting factor subunit 1